jgi:hypothetical protein
MDSAEIPVYDQQEQSVYKATSSPPCYHPLPLFNRRGDCLAAKLRPGNVHTGDEWKLLAASRDRAATEAGLGSGFGADDAFAGQEV